MLSDLQSGALGQLRTLQLDGNNGGGTADTMGPQIGRQGLLGTLPEAWGSTALASLVELTLSYNALSGTLPAAWGQLGVFPKLTRLHLYKNQLTGECAPVLPLYACQPSFTSMGEVEGSIEGLTGRCLMQSLLALRRCRRDLQQLLQPLQQTSCPTWPSQH